MDKKEWIRYPELERIKRMKEEGRELLGENIFIEPKRDGSNVSVWLDEENKIHISSHNLVDADSSIVSNLTNTKEYDKILNLLMTEKTKFNRDLILYGELVPQGKGPTHIEPAHKQPHWFLFDIYNTNTKGFYDYSLKYQTAYHYRLPLIEAIEIVKILKMEDLEEKINHWKTWAKRHRREGVVGKIYKNGLIIGFKEKIDLPKLLPLPRTISQSPIYPPMPEYKILRALQHAWDELTANALTEEEKIALWKDKAKAMPVVAKHISTEAREHYFMVPRNLYLIYLNTDINLIKERPVINEEIKEK